MSININKNDKRTRLIEAADKLFHEQGISNTTLANIAQLSEVPLGNVYYYFKAKDSIVLAVIEYRKKMLQQQLEQLNTIDNAKARLVSLIKNAVEQSENTSNFGDVLGSLCQELGKQGGSISKSASELLSEIVNWCEKQFDTLGKGDRFKKLAINLVSSLQGLCLLTLTFKDPNFISEHSDFLASWIESA